MTGRPYGGTNERSGQDEDVLPGERPLRDDEDAEVGAASEEERPRAGQGGMGTGDRPGFPGS